MKSLTKKILTVTLSIAMLSALLLAVVIFTYKANAATELITIKNEAGIRVERTGLRFAITVNDTELSNLTKEGGTYEGYDASIGAVILPTEFLGDLELKATSTYGENGKYKPAVKKLTNSDASYTANGKTRYYAVMTEIPKEAYEQDLSARGFVKLVKMGAADEYIYTDCINSSIGYEATSKYNDVKTLQVEKEKLAALLTDAMTVTTNSFDKATYEFLPSIGMETDFTFYGNKFGFQPNSEWILENVEFTSGDDGIATVLNGKILAKGEGTTTLTAKMNDVILATSTVTVGDLTMNVGGFTWEYDPAMKVEHGPFTWVNTGLINGTPQKPLTVENAYEVVTDGKYVELDGVYELIDGLEYFNLAANVQNTDGFPDDGAMTTILNETFKIRLTDVENPNKVLTFEYITPSWVTSAWYFGISYTNGTDTLSRGMEDDTVVYSYNWGNTSHAVCSSIPKLVYHGNYQFGCGNGAKNYKSIETQEYIADKLSADNFGAKGFKIAVNSGSKGLVFTKVAQPPKQVTDSTGKFTWKSQEGMSVNYGNFTWTNTNLWNGNTSVPLTFEGYTVITKNIDVDLVGTFALPTTATTMFEFAGTVVNSVGTTTTSIDNSYFITLTDAQDASKVLKFEYLVSPAWDGAGGYIPFLHATYTNGSLNYEYDYTPQYGYNFGNTAQAAYNIPALKYFGNYEFGCGSGGMKDKASGALFSTALSADNFGGQGFTVKVNSGNSGMFIKSMDLPEYDPPVTPDPPVIPDPPVTPTEVKDATGKFSWMSNQDGVSVNHGDFTWTNTMLWNGNTSVPLTFTGHTVVTNNTDVNLIGTYALPTTATTMFEFAGTVINPVGTTTTSIDNSYFIILTDAQDASKVLKFEYLVSPAWDGAGGYIPFLHVTYTNGTKNYEYDFTPQYGVNFGNTAQAAYDIPVLKYFGNYEFGLKSGGIADKTSGALFSTALSADNFGGQGFTVKFNSGNSGMFIKTIALSEYVAPDPSTEMKDATEKFSWYYDPAISVNYGDFTWTNTNLWNGNTSVPLTFEGYTVVTNNTDVNLIGTYALPETATTMFEFAGTVINPEGTTTTAIDNSYFITLTDAQDASKVLKFEYLVSPAWDGAGGYIPFLHATYTNGSLNYEYDYTPQYGYNFGNTAQAAYNIPALKYFGNYEFGCGASGMKDKASGALFSTALSADNFGEQGFTITVNSGNSGMFIKTLPTPVA